MDPATIIGVVIAFGAIFASMIMEGSSPAAILLPAPMMLVVGGTFGAAMAGGLFKDATGIVGQLKKAFLAKKVETDTLVSTIVSLAERARREGMLALEDAAKDLDDPFLKRGLEFAIDGTDPEEVYEILGTEIEAKRKADKAGAKLFADMGGYSPTIGIIGTVIGLVHVLANLGAPAELGALIASAFVATLWGVLLANCLWLPLASRLKRVSEVECGQMELVAEGIMAIQSGLNPRLVTQKLHSLLPPTKVKVEEKGAA
ncbi:MAG: motility protein A [Pseudonocardiales bacterium]|nr:MAG: motility protein A [Pseudonocardiales bacterium]